MSKGLRFFGTDFCENIFGGTASASSNSDMASFAFDGLEDTRWTSSGENTDGNAVYLEMDFGTTRTVNSFFVWKTNIEDVEVQYYTGSAWVTCGAINATLIKSVDLAYLFIKTNSPVTISKVRVAGSVTITPDQEKYIYIFRAFMELGQFEYFPDFTPKIVPKQNVFNITDGRGYVIELGEQFTAKVVFRSHVNQNDINLAELLFARREPFFIWPNGGDETIFRFSFCPYRFRDLKKVTITGERTPKLTSNYYKAGFNDTMNLVEVI